MHFCFFEGNRKKKNHGSGGGGYVRTDGGSDEDGLLSVTNRNNESIPLGGETGSFSIFNRRLKNKS